MNFVLVLVVTLTVLVGSLTWYCIIFPIQPFQGPLPELTDAEKILTDRLRQHVTAIASEPHNIGYRDNLEAAASYIESALSAIGLNPRAHPFTVEDDTVRNIEVVFEPEGGGPATGPGAAGPGTYVIGAHYDSVDDAPGANDNATGVAAVIEIARWLSKHRPRNARVRLVLFVNEEPPYFKTENMGSWRYAKELSESGERVLGMMALETIGFFSDKENSQMLPAPFHLFYGNQGNFIAFVGLPGSRDLLRRSLSSFRETTKFPSSGVVSPGFVVGADWSDHWGFDQLGIPSMMITDTAVFRNPHYHETTDLPHTVDYQSLSRVTAGLSRMICDLAACDR
jgi:hypothetical protein